MTQIKRTTQEITGLSSEILVTYYERLIEISKQLNSTLDHDQLLRQIVSAATELIDTEAASIMLIDPISGELRFEASSNLDAHEMEKIIVPMEGSIAGWIATHGEPRVIHDVSQEPGHFRTVDKAIEFETRNILGVPMRTHKRIIGVVQAVNKKHHARFNNFDVSILTTLASQAAIAIENARLFQQSDFIAEMVHELRTPLLSLKAGTSLLLRPDLPEDRREDLVRTMQSETDRLMHLTTDFLDLARMETGRTQLDLAPFELSQLIHESAEVVVPQAQEKQIHVHADGQQIHIRADRGKVKQILLNLLTNAIKYNRQDGHVRIYTSLFHNQQGLLMVQIAVADTGYGLSAESQKRVFQKFFRDKSTAEKTSGTGLGLVITKAIVEAHGGQIWLESQEGVGTTFFFTLPVNIH
jgi:signal transduction histidine kinase